MAPGKSAIPFSPAKKNSYDWNVQMNRTADNRHNLSV